MSAWVTVWLARQMIEAPGASVAGIVGVHAPTTLPTPRRTAPAPTSVTVVPVRVSLPVLVSVIAYVIRSPTDVYGPVDVTVLSTCRRGLCVIGAIARAVAGSVWLESATATLV